MSFGQCNVNISYFKNTYGKKILQSMLESPDDILIFLSMITYQIIQKVLITAFLIPENRKSAKYVCYTSLKEHLHCCD